MQEKKLNKAVSDVKLMKTPEGKTEVKNAVKDATKKVESKVGDVAEAAAKKAEVVEEKAKEVAKATTKAVVEKAEPVVKKAATEAFVFGTLPPFPSMETTACGSSISTTKPRSCKACRKCLLSSEKRTPLRTLFPFASAAIRSARFVMLFDPGTETSTGIMSAFFTS